MNGLSKIIDIAEKSIIEAFLITSLTMLFLIGMKKLSAFLLYYNPDEELVMFAYAGALAIVSLLLFIYKLCNTLGNAIEGDHNE